MAQGVLDREHPAPRLAEEDEVVPVQPEREADLLDLVDEAVQVPQGRIVRLVAVRRAELVVVVVLDAGAGQVAVARLEVLVRRARPAVQEQHPHRGLLPIRFTHTRYGPFGVSMPIIREPPVSTSSRPELSRYPLTMRLP